MKAAKFVFGNEYRKNRPDLSLGDVVFGRPKYIVRLVVLFLQVDVRYQR